jgi:hypothetical protein
MNDKTKKALDDAKELRDNYGYEQWGMKNWRAWGSWFSWGSPVGLALFFSIPMIAFGIMYWLMHH